VYLSRVLLVAGGGSVCVPVPCLLGCICSSRTSVSLIVHSLRVDRDSRERDRSFELIRGVWFESTREVHGSVFL
jgi:hypothetical protein